MKSDSRVLQSGFLCFVCCRKPFRSSILPLLPCQCTPLTLQMYPFCIPIVLHLKRKSTANGVQLYSFCCKIESLQRNSFMRIETDSSVTCCVLTLQLKPLKTREFRTKDFLVRSTRSFERLKMQIQDSGEGETSLNQQKRCPVQFLLSVCLPVLFYFIYFCIV